MTRTHIRSIRALATGALVLLAACDGTADLLPMAVHSVVLEARGDTRQLTATVTGSDQVPVWRSLTPDVLTVTGSGLATAVGHGEALVEATVGRQSARGIIRVLPKTEVTWTQMSVTAAGPGTETLRARLQNAGGRGSFRVEVWGVGAGGDTVRFLQTPWSTAPVGMDVTLSLDFASPTDGTATRATWVVVEYRADSYENGLRSCMQVVAGSGACPNG